MFGGTHLGGHAVQEVGYLPEVAAVRVSSFYLDDLGADLRVLHDSHVAHVRYEVRVVVVLVDNLDEDFSGTRSAIK